MARTKSRRRKGSRRGKKTSGRRTRSRARRGSRRSGRKVSRRRATRRNPGLAGFSPMSSLRSFGAVAAPVAVGYFGVNLVQTLLDRFVLDKALESQSSGVQTAARIATRLFIGIPAVAWIGSSFMKGKGALIAAGGATNVVVNVGRAVAAQVPGIPDWAQSALGDWPGTPGVYGFATPAGMPALGVSDFAAPTRQDAARLPSLASGGRGMF